MPSAASPKGCSAGQAESEAVARFGPARELVEAEHCRLATPLGALARAGATSAVLLGAIGALAVGASGLIALVIRLVAGSRVLVDVAPGQSLSASDCSRWLTADSHAASCRDAAVADWVNEIVGYRIVVGLLGAVVLAIFLVVRKRWTRRQRWATLPPAVSDTIAMTLFGAAGVWTLAMGIDAIVNAAGHGSGQWLSAAPVALGAAGVFGVRLIRDVRSPLGTPPMAPARPVPS